MTDTFEDIPVADWTLGKVITFNDRSSDEMRLLVKDGGSRTSPYFVVQLGYWDEPDFPISSAHLSIDQAEALGTMLLYAAQQAREGHQKQQEDDRDEWVIDL